MGNWKGIICTYENCQDMLTNWSAGHYVVGAPSVIELEKKLSSILGYSTIVTNRGMTAIMSAIMTYIQAGDIVACSENIYVGTKKQLKDLETQGFLQLRWFNPSSRKSFNKVLYDKPHPMVAITETIGNDKEMRVAHIPTLLADCEQIPCLLIVDTTFTPLYIPHKLSYYHSENIIILGSMTKYHQPEDIMLGGYIMASVHLLNQIKEIGFYNNSAMLPTTADYYLKYIDEIKCRHQIHSENALTLAEICNKHDAVKKVWYPGLPTHPQYNIIPEYHNQAGGVFYFQLEGGRKAAEKLADQLAKQPDWELAVSFGSSPWRIFPWVGEYLEKHAGCQGLIRVSSGRIDSQKNIRYFREALDLPP